MSDCDVVVTGIGIVSPVGIGIDALWDSLVQGKSGITVREEFADCDQPFRIAGEIHDFEPKLYVKPRKALKVMCRPIQFGFAASGLATEQSNIVEQIDPERFSTVFGTEAFYADPKEVARVFRNCIVNRCYDHDRWGQSAMREIEPLWMLKYLPNMVASHISIANDAQGPSNTICQADASSPLAVIEAMDLIRRGGVDAVIAGGTGCLMNTTGMIYRGLHRLSNLTQNPETASRPFDKDRDGMVAAEGGGALILERAEFAEARGATILGRVRGYNRCFHPRNDQFGEGIAYSIASALESANLTSNDIGHVNAQGFSTQEDDIYEAEAIRKVLQDVPVFAPKSSFGNLGPGTGAVEIAVSVEACRNGLLPPSLNVDEVDSRCPINVITEATPVSTSKAGISINFTDTGQITSIVVSA